MNDQKFNRNYLSLISTIAIALATQIYKIFQSTNYFAIVILIIKSASDILLLILCIYCLGKKLTKFKSNFLFIMFFVNKIIIMFVLIFHYEFIYFSIYTADSNLIRKIVEYKNKFYITHGLILVIAMALNIFFIDSFNYEIKIVLCLQFAIPQFIWCFKRKLNIKNEKPIENNDPHNEAQFQNLLIDEIQIKQSSPSQDDLYPQNFEGSNNSDPIIDQNQCLNFKIHDSLISEKIWKKRLNGIPIGLMLVHLNRISIQYYNKCIFKMMKRLNLSLHNQFEMNIMHNLKFKIINTDEYLKKSQLFCSYNSIQPMQNNLNDFNNPIKRKSLELKQFTKKVSIINYLDPQEDKFSQEQSLLSIIKMIKSGELNEYFDNDDGALELYSQFFQQEQNKQIYLNCRIIKNKEKFDDNLLTIIIQDYSRQNILQIKDEQNQFKTKIISSFSHELRTPLNSAILFLKSSILDQMMNNEFKKKYILPSLSSLSMQNLLINDIIDFCQINTNSIEIRLQAFTINELIQDITELFEHELKMKGLGLAFQIDQSVDKLLKTDYQRLIQILTNLIGNAQKFSEQGYILIKIKQKNKQQINFQVIDEGIGIKLGKLRQIKEILKQQYNEISSDWNGLGLLISQMLVRLLKFDKEEILEIQSSGFMQGTTVKFKIDNCQKLQNMKSNSLTMNKKIIRQRSLPHMQEQHGLVITISCKTQSKLLFTMNEQQANEEEQKSIQEDKPNLHMISQMQKTSLICDLNRQFSTLQKSDQNHQKCKCKKIFAVDDEVFNLISLQLLTSKKTKYTIDIAFNGKQAIEKLLKVKKCCKTCTPYKLILMDCSMPIMDGWEATENLKRLMKKDKLPNIPIVGLTAFTSNQDIQRCLKSGMEQVLHKPVQIEKLCQLLED